MPLPPYYWSLPRIPRELARLRLVALIRQRDFDKWPFLKTRYLKERACPKA
jgi:hypothetical protein